MQSCNRGGAAALLTVAVTVVSVAVTVALASVPSVARAHVPSAVVPDAPFSPAFGWPGLADSIAGKSGKLKARIVRRARERLKKKLLTLRLENRQIEDARRIATEKGMGYLTLMRVWIQEGIRREKAKAS